MIGLRFTAAARAAGVESRVTAHSGRVGLAAELTSRGASTTDVMLAGNWKTSRMVTTTPPERLRNAVALRATSSRPSSAQRNRKPPEFRRPFDSSASTILALSIKQRTGQFLWTITMVWIPQLNGIYSDIQVPQVELVIDDTVSCNGRSHP